ncbi:MAG: radical SAM family heme chaperone HemW [Clostridium sp.]|nr:radical SAM family heme chaperone HemW [Clostridium sp.]
MAQSAYIHIPFCKSKCKYCSFVSYTGENKNAQKHYVDILLKEIDYYYKDEPLKTLYLGGGTPSLLETSDIARLTACFNFLPEAEITMEINPETVDTDYLKRLKDTGVNRISVGIQSFNNEILKKIGRIHTAQKALQTLIGAKKAGFENISADFIYGLPDQTLDDFINDLRTVVQTGVKHVSLYGLKIEEDCTFFARPPENLPDDDLQADMYLAAIETLENEGLLHYEISNFTLPSFESRHNLNYWEDGEYYGFGAAAHGYIGEVRYSNFTTLKEYEKGYESKEFLQALSKKERLEETIFLGFRKGEGINTEKINSAFNIEFEKKYSIPLKKYLQSGHLLRTDKGYRLSNQGFLLSNIILSEFI